MKALPMPTNDVTVKIPDMSKLRTPEDWEEWFQNTPERLADIEPNEESVYVAWFAVQTREAKFREWINGDAPENTSAATIAFHTFRDTVRT